jgi:hypothetical protein
LAQKVFFALARAGSTRNKENIQTQADEGRRNEHTLPGILQIASDKDKKLTELIEFLITR